MTPSGFEAAQNKSRVQAIGLAYLRNAVFKSVYRLAS